MKTLYIWLFTILIAVSPRIKASEIEREDLFIKAGNPLITTVITSEPVKVIPKDAAVAIAALQAITAKDLKWFRKGKSLDSIVDVVESYYTVKIDKCGAK